MSIACPKRSPEHALGAVADRGRLWRPGGRREWPGAWTVWIQRIQSPGPGEEEGHVLEIGWNDRLAGLPGLGEDECKVRCAILPIHEPIGAERVPVGARRGGELGIPGVGDEAGVIQVPARRASCHLVI